MRNNVNMVKEKPGTNHESSGPSSSILVLPSILETPDPILDGSDEEEEHPEAQTQALRDYQTARDRVCRVPKDHPREGGLPVTLVMAEAISEGAISDLSFAYSRRIDTSLPLLGDRSSVR
ncbi:hypothetical protein M9H77_31696 [Catharanthus roseus]|uniref:Uncharacterized protein n=1 Tax=Catharanthus roseus TaxID=4058 RepID=A0ACC0A2W0_CATRO|nr:hypothetical protein M9H77_31696 [Catharanthus roseus]